jgi:hypothetical protein
LPHQRPCFLAGFFYGQWEDGRYKKQSNPAVLLKPNKKPRELAGLGSIPLNAYHQEH